MSYLKINEMEGKSVTLVQSCRGISANLTGPMVLKSFNCSKRYVFAAVETFEHHRTGEIGEKFSTNLEIAAVALHILVGFW